MGARILLDRSESAALSQVVARDPLYAGSGDLKVILDDSQFGSPYWELKQDWACGPARRSLKISWQFELMHHPVSLPFFGSQKWFLFGIPGAGILDRCRGNQSITCGDKGW